MTSLVDGCILHGAMRGSEAIMAFPQKRSREQGDRAFFREQIFQTRFRAAVLAAAAMGILLASMTGRAADAGGKLQIYVIDVEGGQSTLFLTSTGQSLLIDTGWPDHNGRDADRIVAAAKQAGISRIDYVLLTHFHVDQ
jgi:beta-lactamase superfamily II metal-dependent hydrolase